MKSSCFVAAGLALAFGLTAVAGAQSGTGTAAKPAATPAATPPPLKLQSLNETAPKSPFPPTNPKFFTAASPSVDTVNTFLKALWGYDTNRIWQVMAIQKTEAPGVSKVIIFVSDKTPKAKIQTTAFFTTPDGKHAIAGEAVIPFGAKPFADARKVLNERADGASRGAAGKDLTLVEFADLECPHCKEAQGTMEQLGKDFPNAHIIFQSFPLVNIHPFAFKAAAYGYCVQEASNSAFFTFAAAVFDTQDQLTPQLEDQTLKAAVTKAGLDPAKVEACTQTQPIKDKVNASIKLAEDLGVDQTPMLAVNGHLLPISQVPYETLKTIIEYQAKEDGVSTGAVASTAPSLTK